MADSYETAMATAVNACAESSKSAAVSASTAASHASSASSYSLNAQNAANSAKSSATTAAEKALLVPYVVPDAKQALVSSRSLLGIDTSDLTTI